MIRRVGLAVARPRRALLGDRGFTLVEMLTNLTISGILVMVIFQLMVSQQRAFSKQQTLTRSRGSLRGAMSLLSWELHSASAADGDLYAIGPNGFTVRSIQGQGVVCAQDTTNVNDFGLWNTSGDFPAAADDSALVFVAGNAGDGDDAWTPLRVQGVNQVGGPCDWGTGQNWEVGVLTAGDVAGVRVGAPYRAFRRTEYSLVQDSSEWWLARRVGTAGSYELLAGPLAAPADSGLLLTYYDRSGNPTTTPSAVAIVQIMLRDAPATSDQGKTGTPKRETMMTRVSLRG